MLVEQNRIQDKEVLVHLKMVILRPNLHEIHNIPILTRGWGIEGLLDQVLEPI
jgi:hypothetical protein